MTSGQRRRRLLQKTFRLDILALQFSKRRLPPRWLFGLRFSEDEHELLG